MSNVPPNDELRAILDFSMHRRKLDAARHIDGDVRHEVGIAGREEADHVGLIDRLRHAAQRRACRPRYPGCAGPWRLSPLQPKAQTTRYVSGSFLNMSACTIAAAGQRGCSVLDREIEAVEHQFVRGPLRNVNRLEPASPHQLVRALIGTIDSRDQP